VDSVVTAVSVLIKNAYYIGKTVLKGAAMYDMGLHPVVVLTGDERDTVVGELYEYLDITCHSGKAHDGVCGF
jgi:gamma-glutamylcyclotransferase (GGCT)/AIG2-like uncharacterized protein YtfP